MNKGPARRIRLRAVVAYPAASVVVVAALALALTPFGPSQGMALAATATPTETATANSTTTEAPSVTTTEAPSVTTTTVPIPSPSSGAVAALAAVPVDHYMLGLIAGPEFLANYFPSDTPVSDAAQFQTFRVRFKFHNDETVPLTVAPQLEFSLAGADNYVAVPEKTTMGIPFHMAREWVPTSLGGGTVQGPLEGGIAVGEFLTGNDGGGSAALGHHSMSLNPDKPITLPAGSYTEEEFTVTLSIDAKYSTDYELRITDGAKPATPLTTAVARISLASPPALQLSGGQRLGVTVVDPAVAIPAAAVAYPLRSSAPVSAVSAVYRPNTVTYALTANALSAATVAPDEIHGPYSMTTDKCAVCHRAHTAKAPNLLVKSSSQSALCFECHGSGNPSSNTDVQSEYTDTALPKNVPSAREYYSHDAVDPTPTFKHSRSGLDEFGAKSNRHSECADCHNSHKAGTADTTQSAAGWTASGRLAGVSGVSVFNGATGSAPKYTFLSGVSDVVNDEDPVTDINPITLEYQLCFKCHSGFTTLTSNDGLPPSQYALDKGVEFNPNNASFHPVEAAGTNKTTKMADSLAGTSPYKLWNFNTGSTIRCLNCHAGGATKPTADPQLPLPGSALAPHTSSNRGILLENYQDRVLKPRVDSVAVTAAYSAGDFALCYVCHGEAPFANAASPYNSTGTGFNLHGQHLTGLAGEGDGLTNIDTSGDGQGNAVCAECHFRIHSTTNTVGVPGGSRLVNFAPNVQPVSGTEPIKWTPGVSIDPQISGGGSCTLTCHGYTHDALKY